MRSLFSLFAVVVLAGCPGGGMLPDGGDVPDGGDEQTVDAGILPRSHNATGYALTVQSGKIVAVGSGGDGSERFPDVFLARVNADLTLDTTFASRGFTHVDFDGGTMDLQSFTTDGLLAVMSDGDKIVATGFARGIATIPAGSPIIARFNADGSLDTTFNTRGYALFDFNPMSNSENSAAGYAIGKRADGKYVFAGGLDNGPTRNRDMFAYRINADGTVDGTFAPRALDFGGSEYANDLVVQGNNLVLGGGDGFTICRLGDDGMLDTSFGTMGSVKSMGGTMYKLLERSDRTLLAVGMRAAGSNDTRLKMFRVSADGVPDASFGAMGVKEIPDISGDIRGAALLGDDSLIVYMNTLAGSRLYKITAAGDLDTTWGMGGHKPTGLRINLLNLLAVPRGSNALLISGGEAIVTGFTLIELSLGNPTARFAIAKIAL